MSDLLSPPTIVAPARLASREGVRGAVCARFVRQILNGCMQLPARALLASVWLYQHTLSPVLPLVLGPSCGCRFAPTCSHYAAEAVRRHGAVIGSVLALRRLLKCTPLHPGGFDPVPATLRLRPCCRRVTTRASDSAQSPSIELTASHSSA